MQSEKSKLLFEQIAKGKEEIKKIKSELREKLRDNFHGLTKELFNQDYDTLSTMEGDHNKWLAISEEKGRFILSPLPGLSTHCMEGLMTPTIDWKKINNDISYNTNI